LFLSTENANKVGVFCADLAFSTMHNLPLIIYDVFASVNLSSELAKPDRFSLESGWERVEKLREQPHFN